MRTSLQWQAMKATVLGLGVVLAVVVTNPSSSHAISFPIPTAGTYVFTSGLTGSFTSDGAKLTDWNITDLLGQVWTPLTPVIASTNNPFVFGQVRAINESFSLDWNMNITTATHGLQVTAGNFGFAASSAVPEASSGALAGLGLGLLMLIDYVRRERRQTGLQVG